MTDTPKPPYDPDDDHNREKFDAWVAKLKAEKEARHHGPGPHPDGSPQSVHGKKGKDGKTMELPA